MTVEYEWDVEETDVHGDIIEHWFHETYRECMEWVKKSTPSAGATYEVVLVRSTDEERAWCYVDGNGEIPDTFHDANGSLVCEVPKRFKEQVRKYHV